MGRERLAAWLATWDGPIRVDAEDVDLAVEGDLAYASALNRMRGTMTDGTAVDLWFRTTMVFARSNGRWLIVHDHSSVPFHMDGSFRAAVDLIPETRGDERGAA
jgi:ketosteroid isomerase-like protein